MLSLIVPFSFGGDWWIAAETSRQLIIPHPLAPEPLFDRRFNHFTRIIGEMFDLLKDIWINVDGNLGFFAALRDIGRVVFHRNGSQWVSYILSKGAIYRRTKILGEFNQRWARENTFNLLGAVPWGDRLR